MNGNLRFIIIPTPRSHPLVSAGYKLICQYGNDEITWGPFKTLPEISDRIREALENLDRQKL
jgi:hypothetical protein